MMQGQTPRGIDDLQGRLPSVLKWCFAGAGAAAGGYYARTDATPIPLSYIIGGAAAGYCLVACLFAGLRLLQGAVIAGIVLLVVNYALLIPFGYGDHLPGWLDTGKAALRWLNPAPLIARWGKDVETRPPSR